MREYYPKKSEIPKDIYKQVVAILQGYDNLKKKRLDILYGTPQKEQESRPSEPSTPTENRAIKLSQIDDRLHAVDQICVWMRGKLGGKVSEDFDPLKAFWSYDYYNCQHYRKSGGDNGPSRSTWNRYRWRFAALIAEKLELF